MPPFAARRRNVPVLKDNKTRAEFRQQPSEIKLLVAGDEEQLRKIPVFDFMRHGFKVNDTGSGKRAKQFIGARVAPSGVRYLFHTQISSQRFIEHCK